MFIFSKRKMNAFLWSWSLTGFFLLSILANGVLGSDEMDLFNLINGTNVFQKQDDGADVLVVGLTPVQTAAAEGAGKSLSSILFQI